MRRSTKIMAATAIALSISGLGATNALALDEETACSNFAFIDICLLAEDGGYNYSFADTGSLYAELWQYHDEGVGETGLDVNLELVDIEVVNAHDAESRLTLVEASISDTDGDDIDAMAGVYTEDGDNDGAGVLVGQSDDFGDSYSGIVWSNDDCAILLASEHLADCPVQPTVPVVPNVPFVNVP